MIHDPVADLTFEEPAPQPEEIPVLTACSLVGVPEGFASKGKSISLAVERDARVYNLVLQVGEGSIVLRGNVHTDVTAHMNTDAAQTAARAFRTDVEALHGLLSDSFAVKVDDVSSSNVG